MSTNDYKQAVWDFILEHSDITPNGSLFIKFHCEDRKNLERRILARYKGYHREDIVIKQELLTQNKIDHIVKKNTKKKKYKRSKKIRMIKRKIINLITLKKL